MRLAVALLLLGIAGCGPRPEPLRVAVGDGGGDDGPWALAVVADDATAASQFAAVLRRQAAQGGGPRLDPAAPATLRITLTAWGLDPEPVAMRRERWADDGGPTRMILEHGRLTRARVALHATLDDADGGRALEPVSVSAYGGPDVAHAGTWRHAGAQVRAIRGTPAEILDAAARHAASAVLEQLAPGGTTTATIPLANGDPAQAELLRMARTGRLDRAEHGLRALVAAEPDNAAAHYNLAAVVDAQGRHREALALYGTALGLRPVEAWRRTAEACRRRAEALQAE